MVESSELAIQNERRRWALLRAVFDLSGGQELVEVETATAAARAGITGDFRRDLGYLLTEGLLGGPGDAEYLWLSHDGLKEAERLLKDNADSRHFRYSVVMIQGSVTGSNIAIGSPGAQQRITSVSVQDATALLPELTRFIREHEIEDAWRKALEAQIEALQAQVDLASPNESTIGIIVDTIEKIAIGAAGSIWATALLKLLHH